MYQIDIIFVFFVCINNQIIVRSSCYDVKTKKEYLVMSGPLKKKLCWNCETRVTLQQENCTFCGVYLSPSEDYEKENDHILIPPYRVQNYEDNSEVPGAPYHHGDSDEEGDDALKLSAADENASMKLVTVTIVFLFLGSIFLLFSAFMLIFSQNGMLTMRWSTDYWYIYLSLAFPLLFLGWKGLNRIPDTL